MKIKFAILFLVIILFGVSDTAHATLNITANVDVPASCSATDTDGVIHNYPQGNSYLAICALETAISNGYISTSKLSNQFPSLGLFITAINNVVADSNSQYWAIYQNGGFANSGITSLPVVAGDVIMFQLHDFSDNNLGDQATLHIHSLVVSSGASSATPSGSGPLLTSSDNGGLSQEANTPPPIFDVQKALTYLRNVQSIDGPHGSFGGSDMYTDWVAVAYGAANYSDSSRDSLLSYMNSHTILSPNLTDNERRAMALLALGQNPYSFKGTNYIDSIIKSFDGTQFGDSSLVNDDIFALIPLQSAGYTANDDIITKDIKFILSKQLSDGSWEESVDLTAAVTQALKSFDSVGGISDSLAKSSTYLASEQDNNGGWGNVSSTSWVMQAMNSLGVSWTKNDKNPLDYLSAQQSADGAAITFSESLQNRIWATSYAIPAVLGKPWNAILQAVPKQVQPDAIEKIPPISSDISTIDKAPVSLKETPRIADRSKEKAIVAKPENSDASITAPIPDVVTSTTASAEKSGSRVPLVVTLSAVVLLGGILTFRFYKRSK